ncbi:probable LRR receptor-like serine/threonine-protein kinase At3g47570 [Asparagus officinalis]|uniref:probable LRR receptor-like serine/threonine-protein kinase At3g47570 n=1 Tax=Asparagus officinalis TaxID=4686 RepID=UPI00098E5986|nr:probable LRR receptor-like serine/threonine-protein kinase At3g47570 [Asparagus officinalis]
MALSPFLFMITAFLPLLLLASSTKLGNFTDLNYLLDFKSQMTDPLRILDSNWTTDTSYCTWIGVSCSRRHPQRVSSLNLYNFSLQGTIHPSIGNLSFLSFLDLSANSLFGIIPESLAQLTRLKFLALEQNSLMGSIPIGIFNVSSLVTVSFLSNSLSGSLPYNQSFMLPRLKFFSVSANLLTGKTPVSFARCQNLQTLSLSNNSFTGIIPTELGQLSKLTGLSLSGNQLIGKIPISLGNLTELLTLDLNFNKLEGNIPGELAGLLNLQFLNLARNKLTGSIPLALLNVSSLSILSLSANNLTGSVPASIGYSLPLLKTLFLGQNQLSGGLPFINSLSNCKSLVSVSLVNNELDGVLPDSVGNLSATLQNFNLADNHIRGNIPAAFGNLSSLLLLSLARNELNGEIPIGLMRSKTLQVLHLVDNKINGSIPSELGLLTSLNTLNLQQNALSGPIPSTLANMRGLQSLLLSGNMLSSRIPKSLGNLRGLIALDLSRNLLDGLIPAEFGNLGALNAMDLSKNQLTGTIPSNLGGMEMVSSLDLSSNSLDGQIPQSLGKLLNIEYMNLSYNFLSGVIPKTFGTPRYLSVLDLSFNKLEGQIPQGRVFSNSSTAILRGNEALCGKSELNFPPCAKAGTTGTGKKHFLKYIIPAVAAALILLAFFFLILRRYLMGQAKIPPQGNTLFANNYRMISYHELVRATNNFSNANLLGTGSFGSVFKASLDDGLVTAVKVLSLDVEGASKSFDVECSALSMLRHRNLVKIISTCSNLDFKALILQFMSNGSLEQWLHSHYHKLSVLQRVNIMVDVSMALEYLHHHHHYVVVHSDIKPSNVLLDENMTAYVSDFGIAKLLISGGKSIVSASTSGTIGYIAPEYGSSGNVTRRSDIYSFGILLLETFTGKKPTDVMFSGESSLRQWVISAYPAKILEIVDFNLLRDDSVDMQLSEYLSIVRQCLTSIIELGLSCSRDLPNERLLMTDVVPRLQKIKEEYLSKLRSRVN